VNLRRLTRATDLLGTIFLIFGAVLGVYYVAAGSYVDESGALIEEFWALGSAWIFILSSIFMAATGLILRLISRRQN
jgi:nitrate reductase gamma subunit